MSFLNRATPAVRSLADLAEGLEEGDRLRRQCEQLIRNLCDRFGVPKGGNHDS